MRVALSVSGADEAQLLGSAERYGHEVAGRWSTAAEAAARLAELHAAGATPELVVALASPHHLTAALLEACDSRGIRIVVVAGSAAERRHAAGLGVIDTVDAPASWDRVTPIAGTVSSFESEFAPPPSPARVATAPPPRLAPSSLPIAAVPLSPAPGSAVPTSPASFAPDPPAGARRGTVIAVWGPGGAPGRTSLAIAIAAELGAAGVYTALGDADTHGASVAPALGLLDEAPGFAAACRLAGAGALSRDEFERIGQFHRSERGGFWVLTGLGRPSRWPELSADRVVGTIAAARDWVDVLVLDTAASLDHDEELSSDLAAPRRNAATLESLRHADHVVAVAAADPIGLSRFLRMHAELLESTDSDRVTVVVNKVRSSAIGPGAAAQVKQTLARFGGIGDPVLVPWDLGAFDAALLSGRPLADAAPRSAARSVIRQLVAERLLAPTAQQTRASGRRR